MTSLARLQHLFSAALELPPEVRAAFLDEECGDDEVLRRESQLLLEIDGQLGSQTAAPLGLDFSQLLNAAAAIASLTGTRVGAFELREELGRGGMGCVYRAERVDGVVSQVVAIKFLRREVLDEHVLRRFRFERQVMATLAHPNIARLLDASQLPDGTPYYVMEYVSGVPITQYCAQQDLDVRERVQLMRSVCDAVAAAHRQLIVHRDLKPSNILVNSEGAPKLLDFGIAKPLSALPGIAASEETGTAQRYFTPSYAAPEQLTGASTGVACDVYALGLLLFEVLVGARPFEFNELSASQVERLITQVPPPAPSAALLRSASAEARARARVLRGDLDSIVLRCLRKAPEERYASVEQLESDLGRYLDGLPVLAGGGHRWYRAKKFVLRNRLAVASGALLGLALVVGLVAFAWQAQEARRRAAEFEQVAKSQADLLGMIDPSRAGVALTRVVQKRFAAAVVDLQASEQSRLKSDFAALWQRVNTTDATRDFVAMTTLRPVAASIEKRFADQPVVEAALSQTISDRYSLMGLNDAALPLQLRALELRRRVLGVEHPDTAASMSSLATLHMARGDMLQATQVGLEVLALRERLLGREHPITLGSMSLVGTFLHTQGKQTEAERYLRPSLEGRIKLLGLEHPDTVSSMSVLAVVMQAQGRLAEAESYTRQSLEIRRRTLGDKDPKTLASINNMGFLLQAQGKLAEAEPYYEEVVTKSRHLLGETDPLTLRSIYNLASLRLDQGHPDVALGLLIPVERPSRSAFLGANEFRLARLLLCLGQARQQLGDYDVAEENLLEAERILERSPGPFPQYRHDATQALLDLYGRWHDREPDKGFDLKAATYRARLEAPPSSSLTR